VQKNKERKNQTVVPISIHKLFNSILKVLFSFFPLFRKWARKLRTFLNSSLLPFMGEGQGDEGYLKSTFYKKNSQDLHAKK
jgi:hypothetical protein